MNPILRSHTMKKPSSNPTFCKEWVLKGETKKSARYPQLWAAEQTILAALSKETRYQSWEKDREREREIFTWHKLKTSHQIDEGRRSSWLCCNASDPTTLQRRRQLLHTCIHICKEKRSSPKTKCQNGARERNDNATRQRAKFSSTKWCCCCWCNEKGMVAERSKASPLTLRKGSRSQYECQAQNGMWQWKILQIDM